MVRWPDESFSIRIGASLPIIRLPQMNADRATIRFVAIVSSGMLAHVEEQTAETAWTRSGGPADHRSKSQTVMISTSTSTTKTIVQTCQFAVGRSERRSLSGIVSLLTRWSHAFDDCRRSERRSVVKAAIYAR
jgi:hypothetical protein